MKSVVLAALLALSVSSCASVDRQDDASLSLDAFAPMLEEARVTRRALETSEEFLASVVPSDAAQRARWMRAIEDVRAALRVARARETDLALLVE